MRDVADEKFRLCLWMRVRREAQEITICLQSLSPLQAILLTRWSSAKLPLTAKNMPRRPNAPIELAGTLSTCICASGVVVYECGCEGATLLQASNVCAAWERQGGPFWYRVVCMHDTLLSHVTVTNLAMAT